MQAFLEKSGMRTAWAQTGAQAHDLKHRFCPDVVLVDIELPDTSGHALIQWLFRLNDCGIIVVSTHGAVAERIAGLELGADDYIAKPPQLRELVARIRAVHRRARLRTATDPTPRQPTLTIGTYRLNMQRRLVTDHTGREIPVTAAEFNALATLIAAAGQPVSRERLSEIALRRPWRAEDRSVDQLIFSIRRKLSDGDGAARLIRSVRGAGYLLAGRDDPVTA
jgi:DNA-binding response OmpR family regulator